MTEKIQLHRRGFLARMLQGAAVATVATGVVLEVTEDKAGASVVKEEEISFFSPKAWTSWDSLLDKLKTTPWDMTDYELFQLSQYILRSRNVIKIMHTYSNLQRDRNALVKVHPAVCHTIVYIATLPVDKRENSQYTNWMDFDSERTALEQSTTWDDLIK